MAQQMTDRDAGHELEPTGTATAASASTAAVPGTAHIRPAAVRWAGSAVARWIPEQHSYLAASKLVCIVVWQSIPVTSDLQPPELRSVVATNPRSDTAVQPSELCGHELCSISCYVQPLCVPGTRCPGDERAHGRPVCVLSQQSIKYRLSFSSAADFPALAPAISIRLSPTTV